MKRTTLILIILVSFITGWAQIPEGYYANAFGKKGKALQIALHTIINPHQAQSYSSLWQHFYNTDVKQSGKVWDIYSDIPNGTPPYEFTPGDDQCGNYSNEGSCYNREHSIPQSWFDGELPMYTDLFHLYPTDGWVNNKRGNFPFGEVATASWTSLNGSKVGSCATSGYTGTVFEPIDEYKGDLARSFFYMTTCYMGKNLNHDSGNSVFRGSEIKDWAIQLFIRWHNDDPVSQKEIDRNNTIWEIQENRNPFIDYPELVGKIFGNDSSNVFGISDIPEYNLLQLSHIYPNPVQTILNISHASAPIESISIFDLQGRMLQNIQRIYDKEISIDLSFLSAGFYILHIQNRNDSGIFKIIKQ